MLFGYFKELKYEASLFMSITTGLRTVLSFNSTHRIEKTKYA